MEHKIVCEKFEKGKVFYISISKYPSSYSYVFLSSYYGRSYIPSRKSLKRRWTHARNLGYPDLKAILGYAVKNYGKIVRDLRNHPDF